MSDINEEQVESKNEYTHFVGVKFLNTPRAYFFGVKDIELAVALRADIVYRKIDRILTRYV